MVDVFYGKGKIVDFVFLQVCVDWGEVSAQRGAKSGNGNSK